MACRGTALLYFFTLLPEITIVVLTSEVEGIIIIIIMGKTTSLNYGLFIPHVICENGEAWWNDIDRRKS
jgi:hypothetical protein